MFHDAVVPFAERQKISMTIGYINLATAVGISKCIGDIEALVFSKISGVWIFVINLGITILGMVARYFLEYGEVSNTYNFTLKNIVIHMIIMMLLSMAFWMQVKRKVE